MSSPMYCITKSDLSITDCVTLLVDLKKKKFCYLATNKTLVNQASSGRLMISRLLGGNLSSLYDIVCFRRLFHQTCREAVFSQIRQVFLSRFVFFSGHFLMAKKMQKLKSMLIIGILKSMCRPVFE